MRDYPPWLTVETIHFHVEFEFDGRSSFTAVEDEYCIERETIVRTGEIALRPRKGSVSYLTHGKDIEILFQVKEAQRPHDYLASVRDLGEGRLYIKATLPIKTLRALVGNHPLESRHFEFSTQIWTNMKAELETRQFQLKSKPIPSKVPPRAIGRWRDAFR